MGKRGPRALDRKSKKIVRKSFAEARTVEEFDKAFQQGANLIGIDKLEIVVKNQEEIDHREAKIRKEVKAQDLQEKVVPATSNLSSSSCTSSQLQALGNRTRKEAERTRKGSG